MDIYQLLYLSQRSSLFQEEDTNKILNTAKRCNALHNITGMLMYRKGVFLQFIEGNKEDVITLYNRIKKDPRHKNLSILFTQISQDRIFPYWLMGYREIGADDLDKMKEIISWNRLLDGKNLQYKDLHQLFTLFKSTS